MMKNKMQGFTLLELMITVFIAILLTAIGIPSFMGLIRDSRMTTNTNDFLTALSYARSEAATRNTTVTIQSKSGTNLDWKDGWDVYIDADVDSTVDPGELLKTHDALPNGYSLTANNAVFDSQIEYLPSGLISTNINGTFHLCLDNDASTARSVVINSLGRARIARGLGCS